MSVTLTFPAEMLRSIVADIFIAAKVPSNAAEVVAACLVQSNLCGSSVNKPWQRFVRASPAIMLSTCCDRPAENY